MLGPSFIILALGAFISTEASIAQVSAAGRIFSASFHFHLQIDCSGMRGRKHTEESWKCDGENEVDICSTVITDCSGGGDWGDEVAGRMEYFFNGLEQGVGQGWDCR